MARHKSEVMAEFIGMNQYGERIVNAPHHNRLHQALRTYDRLIVMWPPEFGKTVQLQMITMHMIGANAHKEWRDSPPKYSGAFIGESARTAKKSLKVIQQYILESEEFQMVWPECVPAVGPAQLWSQDAFNVVRPTTVRLKDPTLQALGAGGPILGARLDFCVCDDILTWDNTRTPDQREAVYQWFKSTVLTRINEGGKVVLLCNAWHPDDLAHRLMQEGWPTLIEPAIDQVTGKALWEQQWPLSRVEEKLDELGPIEGPRKLLHKARDESDMRFTPDMLKVALERGRGMSLLKKWRWANGYKSYTGVDLGVAKTKRRTAGASTSETVLTTIVVHPSGVRQIVDIEAGRWSGTHIMEKVLEKNQKYDSVVIVENNSSQELFVDLMKHFNRLIPIDTYTTGKQAAHPEFGLEKMGVEMKQGMWILPSSNQAVPHGEVYKLVQELYDYKPNLHVGDRVRSLMFAWEGARKGENKTTGMHLRLMSR